MEQRPRLTDRPGSDLLVETVRWLLSLNRNDPENFRQPLPLSEGATQSDSALPPEERGAKG